MMKKLLLGVFFCALLCSCGKDEEKSANASQEQYKVIGTDLGDGYSQDSTEIYFKGDTVEVADMSTFKVIGGGYAKDNFSAYYNGKEVKGADGATFQYVAGDTARDMNDTYVKGVQKWINQ